MGLWLTWPWLVSEAQGQQCCIIQCLFICDWSFDTSAWKCYWTISHAATVSWRHYCPRLGPFACIGFLVAHHLVWDCRLSRWNKVSAITSRGWCINFEEAGLSAFSKSQVLKVIFMAFVLLLLLHYDATANKWLAYLHFVCHKDWHGIN